MVETKTVPLFVNPNPGHCRTCGVELANRRHQYCTEHRPASAPPQRRAKATRIAAAAKKSAGAAVLEIVPGAGGSSTSKGPAAPSTADWDESLGKLAVGLTWGLGLLMTRGEPREIRGSLAVELSMTDDEAAAVTHPIAARFAGTALNRRHGRKILETLALTEPLIAVMQYTDRVHEYRFERARRDAAGTAAPHPYLRAAPPQTPPPTPPQEGHHDDADAAAAAAVPPVTGYLGGPFGAA